MLSPRRKEEAVSLSRSYLALIELVHDLTLNNESNVASSAPVWMGCVLFVFYDSEVFVSNQHLSESGLIGVLL